MSAQGRPKGEYRKAQPEGNSLIPPGRPRALAWLESGAVLALLLALWWLASHQGWVSRVFLPTPEATLASLLQGLNLSESDGASPGELAAFTTSTLWRMLAGWGLASLAGVALAP